MVELSAQAMALPVLARLSKFSVTGVSKAVMTPPLLSAVEVGISRTTTTANTNRAASPRPLTNHFLLDLELEGMWAAITRWIRRAANDSVFGFFHYCSKPGYGRARR